MKRILSVFLLIGIFCLTYFVFSNKIRKEKNPYQEEGYSEEMISKIEKLSPENQNYLLEEDYLKNLEEILNHHDFDETNLKKYIEFSKLYSLNLDDVIYIVNHGYDNVDIYNEATLGLMHSTYYIHDYLERYLNYDEKLTTTFATKEEEYNYVIGSVNSNLDYAFYTHDQEVDLKKENLILVNKYYKLLSDYVPENLVTIERPYGVNLLLESNVYAQYQLMWQAAKEEGLSLYIRSPYRSYYTQQTLYNRYAAKDGTLAADTYSARPGYSEHQTGLAFDVTSPSTNFDTFEASREFRWLQENAYKYGFILRYPKGKEYITGYIYEPWHYRYVGIEAATKIHEAGITYEEYYAYYVR